MANRLKAIPPKIISPLQGAFVLGRDIHDNILVAHEILNSFSIKKINKATKTYDRLECHFIHTCLRSLGFSEKWSNWVNEVLGNFFKPSGGKDKGTPYPLIFSLSMRNIREDIFTSKSLFRKLVWWSKFLNRAPLFRT